MRSGGSHSQLIKTREVDSDSQVHQGTFDNEKPRRSNSWAARFSGWRGGLLMSLATSSFALVLNVALAIVATVAWEPKNGIAQAFIGNCRTAGRMTIGLHLLINLLSSALLGASSYTVRYAMRRSMSH
jgi:hypothetical protein